MTNTIESLNTVNVVDYPTALEAAKTSQEVDPDWTYEAVVYDVQRHGASTSVSGKAFRHAEYFVVEITDEEGEYLGTF